MPGHGEMDTNMWGRKKMCHNCLQPRHIASRCLLNNNCLVSDCGKKHSTHLHSQKQISVPTVTVMKQDQPFS